MDKRDFVGSRLNQNIASLDTFREEYKRLRENRQTALDKLAEIVRAMDELDILEESILESRGKITAMVGKLRQEMGALTYHDLESAEVLDSILEQMIDDQTVLGQSLTILRQTSGQFVGDTLAGASEESMTEAIKAMGDEDVQIWADALATEASERGLDR
jgi:chromosome segregation ATPase